METPASLPSFGERRRRFIALGLAIVALLIHLLTNSRYGYFRDELYFIACARNLAWGYVDFAPLSALLLRIELILFGESLFAIRVLPAFAHAGTIVLTGVLARQLGGRTWAVGLSCTGSLCALVYLGIGNFYSLNAFEPLFWMGCVAILLAILNGSSPRLWLAFGVFAGLGFLNKHSFVFFGVALVSGLLLMPARNHFRQRWVWLGGLVAFLIALPHLIWQAQNDWPTLELLRNVAASNKNVVHGPLAFIGQQILIMSPATLPLWLFGLVWLLIRPSGPGAGRLHAEREAVGAGAPSRRSFAADRVLGLAYLITLAIFILLKGKHYYLAPIYPMLFAAGGVAWEQTFARRFRWLKPALAAAMIAMAALLAPTILPLLSPEKLLAYMRAIHFEPPRTETSHTAALPQLFADQFGWEEMVRSVARVYSNLTPEEQKRVGIFCQNYGQAGAIDLFGEKYGLPPALSGHQNYFLWGPRGYSGDLLIVIDRPGGDEPEQFRSVEDFGLVGSSPWAMPFEQRAHIYLCRDLKMPIRDAWPHLKKWL